MYCIMCRANEAIYNNLFCLQCAVQLSQEDMQKLRGTLIGQQALAYLQYCELKQAIKSALPRWLRRLV